jgi:hypothetical protein
MENSILSVNVIQADDLRSTESEGKYFEFLLIILGGNFEPYVILAIEE